MIVVQCLFNSLPLVYVPESSRSSLRRLVQLLRLRLSRTASVTGPRGKLLLRLSLVLKFVSVRDSLTNNLMTESATLNSRPRNPLLLRFSSLVKNS